ncbi:MAG: hypothetical protein IKI77_10120 [Oscillospiraceae bacterium]|nr:hypothetical protein [Oscillospiraceae bacterium]
MKQNERTFYKIFTDRKYRPLWLAAAGAAAGFMTTIGSACGGWSLPGMLLMLMQMIGSGVFLWAVACTFIAVSAKTPLHAAGEVLCYLAPMIACSFLCVRLTGCWYSEAIMQARMLALIPAALLGAAAWFLRRSEGLRIAAMIAGAVLLIFDLRAAVEPMVPVLAAEAALAAAFYLVLRHLGEDQRERILYRRNFMGSCEPVNRF